MPVQVSYPGVYIEEIPSGNVTISGVATSITAFLGRTRLGPVNEPKTCLSFGDYERFFGGLDSNCPVSYAVQDFFMNGGSQAVVVRATKKATAASVTFKPVNVSPLPDPTKADGDAANKALTDAKAGLAATPATATDADVANAQKWVNAVPLLDKLDATNTALLQAQKDLAADPGNEGLATTVAALQERKMDLTGQWRAATIDYYSTAVTLSEAAVVAGTKVLTDAQKALITALDADDLPAAADQTKLIAAVNEARKALTAQQKAASDAKAALAKNSGGPNAMTVTAANPGDWGNSVSISINRNGIDDQVASKYRRYGIVAADLFNMIVTYVRPDGSAASESYASLTLKDAPNKVDSVLKDQSLLVTATVATPGGETDSLPDPDFSKGAVVAKLSNGSSGLNLSAPDLIGSQEGRTGLYALEKTDLFNLLCIPPDTRGGDTDTTVLAAAAAYCAKRRAMMIVDPPTKWTESARKGNFQEIDLGDLGIGDTAGQRNSAVFFPRIKKKDLEMDGMVDTFPACGAIAGVIAATDVSRGVWKAPAGIGAGIAGITGVEFDMTDPQNGLLNPNGVNCLRTFPIIGSVVWGSRTLRGADLLSDDYKYLPVRRLTLYIEESLYRGTKFAVFEPNAEPLWAQLRLSVGAFMADLSRQGAFYGYSVACDKSTTSAYDIERGIVHVRVAFAPVKPAEFIILQIQQQAGQTAA